MVRFSNSKLSSTQYVVTGITPVTGSSTAVVSPISPATLPAGETLFSSQYISGKSSVGVSSSAYDVALSPGAPDSNLDLGLLYSNGYRYQYANYKIGATGGSVEMPTNVVTVQVQTESGPVYVDQVVSSYTLIQAYVGNNVAVPQQPNPNIVAIANPAPSKLEPLLTNNNNC